MVARVIDLLSRICSISILFTSSYCFAQSESGVSLIQAWRANADSFRNYDVSFRHWRGYNQPDQKAENDDFDVTESLTNGRIVVDRMQQRIAFASECTMYSDAKQTRNFEYVTWDNGMEASMSESEPFPRVVPRTFELFCKSRFIPIVECTLTEFPSTLLRKSLNEDSAGTIRFWSESTAVPHPDGSVTVGLKFSNNRYGVRMEFDPISTMPTKIAMDDYDPNSGAFLKTFQSGNPRYEKFKEVYRIISHEYDNRTKIRNSPRKLVGTVQFTWHQFNEEVIRFPNADGAFETIDDAKKFLRLGIEEEVK